MSKNSRYEEVEKPNINLDVANKHHLVSLDSEKGKKFNLLMHGIMDKLFKNDPQQQNVLKNYEFDFFIQDTKDKSIARVRSKDDIEAWNLSGKRFAVMFNKEKLQRITSEDELAFILGHEISHVLHKSNPEILSCSSYNEELACDFNAIDLMAKAGYSIGVVKNIDHKIFAEQNPEMAMRSRERNAKIASMYYIFDWKPFDGSEFTSASFKKMSNKYKSIQCSDSDEVALSKMMENLQLVYNYGGQDAFKDMFCDYVEQVVSEKASKLFLNTVAKATEDFPPIDEVKVDSYEKNKYLRHPISVMTNISPQIDKLEGKKLYPPAAQAKISKYIKQNPNYFHGMDFIYDKWLKPQITYKNNGRV